MKQLRGGLRPQHRLFREGGRHVATTERAYWRHTMTYVACCAE